MSVQPLLRAALRDVVGPSARAHGYRGSAPTWRRSSERGDWAVVNVQSSSWNTAEEARCTINLAFAPEPYLRYLGWRMPGASASSGPVRESSGLFRTRLEPSLPELAGSGWWVVTDDASAHRATTDMVDVLATDGWPVLDELFDRDVLLARVREGRLGDMFTSPGGVLAARVEALLLMDAGPSAELDDALARALDECEPSVLAGAEQLDAWIRHQAAAR